MDLLIAGNMLPQKKEGQNGTTGVVITSALVVQGIIALVLSVLAAMLSWKANTEINLDVGTAGKWFYAIVAFLFSTVYYVFYGLYYGLSLGKEGICK